MHRYEIATALLVVLGMLLIQRLTAAEPLRLGLQRAGPRRSEPGIRREPVQAAGTMRCRPDLEARLVAGIDRTAGAFLLCSIVGLIQALSQRIRLAL